MIQQLFPELLKPTPYASDAVSLLDGIWDSKRGTAENIGSITPIFPCLMFFINQIKALLLTKRNKSLCYRIFGENVTLVKVIANVTLIRPLVMVIYDIIKTKVRSKTAVSMFEFRNQY